MRERDAREREMRRERDVVMRDPRDIRDARDVGPVAGTGRPDPRMEPRDMRADPRDSRPDPRDARGDPRARDAYLDREWDTRLDRLDGRERGAREREMHERDRELWERDRERKERAQWEREQEAREREKKEREQREQMMRERDIKDREVRERERDRERELEREQMQRLRDRERERELREKERELQMLEREKEMRGRDVDPRDGPSRNPVIIGPGVPPPTSASSSPNVSRDPQRPTSSQAAPGSSSNVGAGPLPPQSHHQGRFNTAFISNFVGQGERHSRNNSRVGSPNMHMGRMGTIDIAGSGPMPTTGPGVPGKFYNNDH